MAVSSRASGSIGAKAIGLGRIGASGVMAGGVVSVASLSRVISTSWPISGAAKGVVAISWGASALLSFAGMIASGAGFASGGLSTGAGAGGSGGVSTGAAAVISCGAVSSICGGGPIGTTKDTMPATTTLNTPPITMPPINPRAIEKSLLFISSVKRGSGGRLPLTMGLKPEHVMTMLYRGFLRFL